MTETRDTYAYFWVTGFECHWSAITEEMGVEATTAWNRGELRESGITAKFSSWQLNSPLPRGDEVLDAHIAALLPGLEERAGAVLSLGSRFKVGLNCVGYFYGASPGFHLDSDLIRRLGALNLEVDFDLYCYGCDDAP